MTASAVAERLVCAGRSARSACSRAVTWSPTSHRAALPALLPFLRTELHLSYTRTAAIMLAATVSSSVVQPFFGHLFDTRRGDWLLVAGPALAGVGIGLLAFVHTFELALLCVLASSVGVAAFHPEASKFAAWLSGERRSTAMSVFSVGGNLGVAIGPLLAGVIAAHYGLGGVWLLAIPGLAIAGAQLAGLAALGGATAHARVATALAGRDRWGATGLLLVALMVRGYVHFGLITFIPLFEHDARHNSNVVRLARARAHALRRCRGHARDRPRGRPLRPPAPPHAHVPDRLLPAWRSTSPTRGCSASPGSPSRARGSSRRSASRSCSRRSTCRPASRPPPGFRSGSRSASAVRRRSRSAAWPTPIGLTDALWTIPPAALLGTALCSPAARAGSPSARPRLTWSPQRRSRPTRRATTLLEELAERHFDLLVVGGGIVGCAVAWLGAHAGLRVALVERGDLAGATSSASSKLIHGGLRYLQMGDIGLVREAHAERHALARVVAPHLVRPRAFLVPVYRGGPIRATKLRAGLVLYGGLGRFADGGGSLLRPAAARALVPPCARTVSARPAATSTTRPTTRA